MTDQGAPPPDGGPATPKVPWDERSRVVALADWLVTNRESFTEAALERSALQGGYTAEEYAEAARLATQRPADDASLDPIKSSARRYVLAAYGIVWLLFAIVYLLRPFRTQDETVPSYGSALQLVLTISLGIGLGISLLVIRAAHPDPGRRDRALALLLAVPVILLIGVAGTCLPFVGSA